MESKRGGGSGSGGGPTSFGQGPGRPPNSEAIKRPRTDDTTSEPKMRGRPPNNGFAPVQKANNTPQINNPMKPYKPPVENRPIPNNQWSETQKQMEKLNEDNKVMKQVISTQVKVIQELCKRISAMEDTVDNLRKLVS